MNKEKIKKIIEFNNKSKIYEWKKRFRFYKIIHRLEYDNLWLCWIIEKNYILNGENEAYKVTKIKAEHYLGL